jgi:hypothetical protein
LLRWTRSGEATARRSCSPPWEDICSSLRNSHASGNQPEDVTDIEAADGALLRLAGGAREHGVWALPDADYLDLCVALEVLDRQLTTASLGDIAKAEARMLEGLLRTKAARPLSELV